MTELDAEGRERDPRERFVVRMRYRGNDEKVTSSGSPLSMLRTAAREGRITGAQLGGPKPPGCPARLPPGERGGQQVPRAAAPKRCGRRSLVAGAKPGSGRLPVAASTSGARDWPHGGKLKPIGRAGGPEPAGASNGAPPKGSPALTVCCRPKPLAAQSSRWGGVGRGGEAAIESVASGGGKSGRGISPLPDRHVPAAAAGDAAQGLPHGHHPVGFQRGGCTLEQ
uniref:Uncharacterized protein n=1 Tax=Sphaerodactylus townsendi TaxID=933632 RepID=A0ACB8F7R8_9SAUR